MLTGQPTVLTRSISLKKDPEEVFAIFATHPGCFFLDSALADHELSRFSYIGSEPFLTLKSRGLVMDIVEGKKVRHQKGHPLEALQAYLQRYQAKSGWEFLTGTRADIDAVMRAFDAYVPNKMSHRPIVFIRTPADGSWVRLYGFASSADLMAELERASGGQIAAGVKK